MRAANWFGKQTRHEGLPLALRVRPVSVASHWLMYLPHLAKLTHEFNPAQTRPDGMPLPKYNDSLSAFDAAAHDIVEGCRRPPTPRHADAHGIPKQAKPPRTPELSADHPNDPLTAPGLMLVVETLCGKRIYYAATRERQHANRWLTDLQREFPRLPLTAESYHDQAAAWYKRYAADFGLPPS
jgi:hypothetical protein